MIIDMHTHIYNEQMWASYQRRAGKNKITKVIVIPWYNKNIPDEPDTEDLLKFTDKHEQLFPLGSIDMEGNIKKQLAYHEKLLHEKRIFGIKLYPGYQHFYASDKEVLPVAALCQKYNKPLVFHCGDVYDVEGKAHLKYSHPIYVDDLANDYPEVKIVISHFGFPYLIETANLLMKNKNVFSDISGSIEIDDSMTSNKHLKSMVSQYILDLSRVFTWYPKVKQKVMFGTDYCGEDTRLSQVQAYKDVINKLFTAKERNHVYFDLANKIYFEEKN